MDLGFFLMLIVVFLAALSPVVLAFALGSLFVPAAAGMAGRIAMWGAVGFAFATVLLGTWMSLASRMPSFNWAERFAMGAAGFTFFAVIGPVVEAMLGRLRTAARGAPNISIEPTPDGAAHVRR